MPHRDASTDPHTVARDTARARARARACERARDYVIMYARLARKEESKEKRKCTFCKPSFIRTERTREDPFFHEDTRACAVYQRQAHARSTFSLTAFSIFYYRTSGAHAFQLGPNFTPRLFSRRVEILRIGTAGCLPMVRKLRVGREKRKNWNKETVRWCKAKQYHSLSAQRRNETAWKLTVAASVHCRQEQTSAFLSVKLIYKLLCGRVKMLPKQRTNKDKVARRLR